MFRHFLLGVGITVLVSSLLLMVVEINSNQNFQFDSAKMKEQEIVKMAKSLGMSFPSEGRIKEFRLASKFKLENKFKENSSEDLLEKDFNLKTNKKAIKSKKLAKVENKDDIIKDLKEELKREIKEELELKKDRILLDIPVGMSSSDIATLLVHKGLIDSKRDFIILLDELDVDRKIKAGTYSLEVPISPVKLLLKLTGVKE